jgi:hypothetical protein
MRANDGIVKVDQGRRLRSAEPAFIYFTHRSTRSGQTNLALSLSAPVRRVGVLGAIQALVMSGLVNSGSRRRIFLLKPWCFSSIELLCTY